MNTYIFENIINTKKKNITIASLTYSNAIDQLIEEYSNSNEYYLKEVHWSKCPNIPHSYNFNIIPKPITL